MFIYVITNIINGKQYVGQTCQKMSARWSAHIQESRRLRGSCPILHRAIRKYGAENFIVEAINLTAENSQHLLDIAERWFIDELNTRIPNGYNVEHGGRGGRRSRETVERIAAKHRGMKRSVQTRENIGAAQRGRKRNPDSVRKMVLTNTGRKRGPMSEAQKLKISIAKTGTVLTSAHKTKIGAASRAAWNYPGYREKMSQIHTESWARKRRHG